MAKLVIVIISAFLASVALTEKLPSSFTKCDRKRSDFDQCLTKAVENAIQQMNKPFREVGLPNLEPLEVPKLTIGAGSGPVGFQQNFTNIKLTGITNIKCSKVEFDSVEKKLSLDCYLPQVVMAFTYEINGKILLLPIYGKGPGSITLYKMRVLVSFSLKEVEKNGEEHFKIVDVNNVTLIPQLVSFKMDNLFDGDKTLGDNVVQVMNDNWADVFADVKSSYEEAYGRIFASIFDSLLEKVPIKDLFEE